MIGNQADRVKQEQTRENLEQLVIIKKELRNYPHLEVIEKVGQGSFGDIYKVWDSKRSRWAAMKFEKKEKKNKYSLIKKEAQIMHQVKGSKYFSVLFDSRFSEQSNYNFIEMSFLGPNLENLKKRMNSKFSLRTVLLIANQMISGLQVLHEKGIIHRDIKPENFVIGSDGQHHQVYVIDFGLSKYFIDENKKHIEQKSNKGLVGTARYTSVNSHLGLEQSRRDDMESLAYLLLYFVKGTLVWQNLQFKDKEERFKKIAELKQTTSNEQQCKGLPQQFNEFLNLVKSLKYEQTPEYDKYRALFSQCYSQNYTTPENQCCYDWCPKNCVLQAKAANKVVSTKNLSDNSPTAQQTNNPNSAMKSTTSKVQQSNPQILQESKPNISQSNKIDKSQNTYLNIDQFQGNTFNGINSISVMPNGINQSKIDMSQSKNEMSLSKNNEMNQSRGSNKSKNDKKNGNGYQKNGQTQSKNGINSNKNNNQQKQNSTKNESDLLAILDKQVSRDIYRKQLQSQDNYDDENLDEVPISEFKQGERKRIPIFKTEDNFQKHSQHSMSQVNLISSTINNNVDKGISINRIDSVNNIQGHYLKKNYSFEGKLGLESSFAGNRISNMNQYNNMPHSTASHLAIQPFSNSNIINKDSSQYPNNLSNEWNSEQDEKVQVQQVMPFNPPKNQQQF